MGGGAQTGKVSMFRKMWFLVISEDMDYTHTFYQLGALVKHTGVWWIFLLLLKASAPQKYSQISKNSLKVQNGILFH